MTISRRVRFILMSIALVAFAVAVWFLVLNPLRGDINATEVKIDEAQTQLSAANLKLAQAETTKAEGKRNQARLLELAKMMPPAEELPSLLLQIQTLADEAGIDFISISPGTASLPEGSDYAVLPLDLSFTGTFFDLSDFAYRAEQMVAGPGRLLSIKSISLAKSGQITSSAGSPELDVSVSLLAFVMSESASAPAEEAETTAPAGSSDQ